MRDGAGSGGGDVPTPTATTGPPDGQGTSAPPSQPRSRQRPCDQEAGRSTRVRLTPPPGRDGGSWAPGPLAGDTALIEIPGEDGWGPPTQRNPLDVFYDAVVAAGGGHGCAVSLRSLVPALKDKGLAEAAVQIAAEEWHGLGVMVLCNESGTGCAWT